MEAAARRLLPLLVRFHDGDHSDGCADEQSRCSIIHIED
jgi:hypothetical protein